MSAVQRSRSAAGILGGFFSASASTSSGSLLFTFSIAFWSGAHFFSSSLRSASERGSGGGSMGAEVDEGAPVVCGEEPEDGGALGAA
jgi:hypothetical protein